MLFLKRTALDTRFIFMSHPSRRYTNSVAMLTELQTLGSRLYDLLDAMDARVTVIVSADLAHTHDADGPYGYSPSAQPFDTFVGKWAASRKPLYLLQSAAGLVDAAKSCGFTGLVMLQGMMSRANVWTSKVLANDHPSYYGMMVAAFTRPGADMAVLNGTITQSFITDAAFV